MGGLGGVLTCVAWVGGVLTWVGMLLFLLLVLLKYYPEEKNTECLLLKQKMKKFFK